MNSLKLRIAYADTDQIGMVCYANYLTFFQQECTEASETRMHRGF
jgi:acyl-CoA thioesterase FadM